jgi:hypothetical protein
LRAFDEKKQQKRTLISSFAVMRAYTQSKPNKQQKLFFFPAEY